MNVGVGAHRSDGAVFERLVAHPSLGLLAGINADRPEVQIFDASGDTIVTRAVLRTSTEPYPTQSWRRASHVPSAAWHPDAPLLVITSDQGLLEWTPNEVRPVAAEPTNVQCRWLAFGASGSHVWASPTSGDDGWESSEIVDLATGEVSEGPRWDTNLVQHPSGSLVATLNSDQGATLFLFATTSNVAFLDRALILDADGYEAPLFSPDGSRFAVRGNAYEQSLEVFDFPSLRRAFGTVLGDPSPGYPYPADWQAQFRSWSPTNVGWASSQDLLVGTPAGAVVSVDVVSGDAEVVDEFGSAIRALTVCTNGAVVVSLADGRLQRLSSVTRAAVGQADEDPVQIATRFIDSCTELDPAEEEIDALLKLTDGIRDWDPGELGTVTTAGDDEPTWLRLQAFMNVTREHQP